MVAASDLLKAIDVSVDPCEDFYEFACGNWIRDHDIPADKPLTGVTDDLRENLQHQIKGTMTESVTARNECRNTSWCTPPREISFQSTPNKKTCSCVMCGLSSNIRVALKTSMSSSTRFLHLPSMF